VADLPATAPKIVVELEAVISSTLERLIHQEQRIGDEARAIERASSCRRKFGIESRTRQARRLEACGALLATDFDAFDSSGSMTLRNTVPTHQGRLLKHEADSGCLALLPTPAAGRVGGAAPTRMLRWLARRVPNQPQGGDLPQPEGTGRRIAVGIAS